MRVLFFVHEHFSRIPHRGFHFYGRTLFLPVFYHKFYYKTVGFVFFPYIELQTEMIYHRMYNKS